MGKTKPFIRGTIVGMLIWGFMTLLDAVDEYVIDTECFLGAIACLAVPLCMSVWHIIDYLKRKLSLQKILSWFSGFLMSGIILAIVICYKVNNHQYIVDNSCHGCSFLCFNGLEYFIYAYFAIGGFTLICIIFHILYAIIKNYIAKMLKKGMRKT